jgi:hypothetical protein
MWRGVPRAICEKWQAKAEGDYGKRFPGGRGQYRGTLIEGIVAMLLRGEDGGEAVFEWMAEDGAESQDQRAVCRWSHWRVGWGKIETTRNRQVI